MSAVLMHAMRRALLTTRPGISARAGVISGPPANIVSKAEKLILATVMVVLTLAPSAYIVVQIKKY